MGLREIAAEAGRAERRQAEAGRLERHAHGDALAADALRSYLARLTGADWDELVEVRSLDARSELGGATWDYWQRLLTTDGVTFAYGDRSGIYLATTCPDCGQRRYHSVFSLADIDRPGYSGHRCYEAETRRIAAALSVAADRLKMSPQTLALAALDRIGGAR